MPLKDVQARREFDNKRYYRRSHNPNYNRHRKLMAKYGISLVQRDAMWERQGGRCGACRCEVGLRDLSTNVDHDHDTGLVRGILCERCNSLEGFMAQVARDGKRAAAIRKYLAREHEWQKGQLSLFPTEAEEFVGQDEGKPLQWRLPYHGLQLVG